MWKKRNRPTRVRGAGSNSYSPPPGQTAYYSEIAPAHSLCKNSGLSAQNVVFALNLAIGRTTVRSGTMLLANALPSAREAARALGGHVRLDGAIAFPRPGGKRNDRSCTLWFGASFPDGFNVADSRKKIPWRELKDYVRDKLGVPFVPRRRQRSGG